MRIVLFAHSLLSCWDHADASFLRGVASELAHRGHGVRVYEPESGAAPLVRARGAGPLRELGVVYPALDVRRYAPAQLELDEALDGADLVWVHARCEPALVRAIGGRRAKGASFVALFHDTLPRAASAPEELERLDLSGYDGVLAFGAALEEQYVKRGWARRAWTWHHAADARLFSPRPAIAPDADLVFLGNWAGGARDRELMELLVEPCRALGLRARVHGVGYPDAVREAMAAVGIEHGGWLASYRAPAVYARHRVTVHVPRRVYPEALPGIPTVRMFEALACGVPVVSAPWTDVEGLFRTGEDYLVARDGVEMTRTLAALLADGDRRAELARHGRETVLARHTCAHRVDELLAIAARLGLPF